MRDRIQRCLQGDRAAFGELMELFEGVLFSFAHHLSRSRGEAEELVQETFVRAFRTLDRLQDPDRCLAWLKGICRNVHRENRRKRAEEPEIVDLDRLDRGSMASEVPGAWLGGLSASELFDIVSAEIHRMAEPYQLVLTLRHFNRLSCREIARRLGVSVGTVTMRLSRGHRHLREILQKQLELSDGGTP